jgi:hypothetical protein
MKTQIGAKMRMDAANLEIQSVNSLAIPGASSRRTDQQLLRFPNLLPEIFIIRRFRSHERGVWVYPDASATSIKDQKNPSI